MSLWKSFAGLLALVVVLASTSQAGFIAGSLYPVGPNPYAVAVGDFNGDGILDLAVANYFDGQISTVSILLGNGDGSFQAPSSYVTGRLAYSVVVGDWNSDGHLDLAVTGVDQGGHGTVAILLGNGDGTFQAAVPYSAGSTPQAVVAGDFNADGYLDLAVAESALYGGTPSVSVLLGNGDGTFQAAQTSPFAYGQPYSLAAGDFNQDGYLDLAVTNGTTATILLGKGDGTFHLGRSYADQGSVAVGDFNGDGILDLALTTTDRQGSTAARVLLGNGDGTFQTASSTPIGQTGHVAVGDFNGDGHLDFVVAGEAGLTIVLGNGDGTLTAGQTYAPGATFVAVADFNHDGALDLAVPNIVSGTVSVLLGNGQGTFRAAPSYAAGSHYEAVAMGDFNGDGHLDLAVTNRDSDTVSILLGNGDGTFQAAQSVAVGSPPVAYPNVITVGDFNGDGIPDLAVANTNNYTISIFLGKGDGTFRAPHIFNSGYGVSSMAVGDFNGDGKLDIVTANFLEPYRPRSIVESDVRVFLGNGDGTFKPSKTYTAGFGPNSVAVADFNGDGVLDLAVTNGGGFDQPGSTVSIFLGRGDGTFRDAQTVAVDPTPAAVAVGDFNGDGVPDLAVTSGGFYGGGSTVSILLGNGDGTFQPATSYPAGNNPTSVVVGDFNGDGNLDLGVVDQDSSTVNILLGNGNGTFAAAQRYAVVLAAYSLALGDVNGDGRPDLAVGAVGGGSVTILVNDALWP